MKNILQYLFLFSVTFLFSDSSIKKKADLNSEIDIKILEKSFDLFKINYVDSLVDEEIIKAGIKGMLNQVDPYTKLLVESSKDNVDALRTGKYGGIGIQMGLVRDSLTVFSTFENSPAYFEGLNVGDYIMKIDTTFTDGLTVSECSKLIKGKLGTDVLLTVYRPGTREKIEFALTRDNIQLKKVPYWGLDQGVGYVRLTKFSKNSDKDFKNALIDLNNNNLEGLIIDLRGNSGGLLNVSKNILEYFTNRGELLFTQKGKTSRSNKEYISRRKAIIDEDIPIVVLEDKNSASASEIVSGSLQDLDRAVIMGQTTFGKGLVQHIYDLNEETSLRITTAKYYLPSGRIIQKQDYLNNGFLTDGLDKNDSTFVTKKGRIVFGGGGVQPDIVTTKTVKSNYINALWRNKVFLTFGSIYIANHPDLKLPVDVNDHLISDFKKFLETYKIDYLLPGESEYNKMKNKINANNISINPLSKHISINKNYNDLKFMDDYFKQLKEVQFYLPHNKKEIKYGIIREFSKILGGEREQIKASLYNDSEYIEAKKLLLNKEKYYSILSVE